MKKTQMAAALAGVLLSAQLMAQTVVTVNGTKIDSVPNCVSLLPTKWWWKPWWCRKRAA